MQIIRNRKWSISFDNDYLKTTIHILFVKYPMKKLFASNFFPFFFTDPLSDNNLRFQQCRKIIDLEFFLETIRFYPVEIKKFGRRAGQTFTNIRKKQSYQEIAHRESAWIRWQSRED